MLAGSTVQPQPRVRDVILDLAPSWEECRSRLRRNIRESLRHGYNSLRRDGHRFELQVLERPAEVRAGLERFVALHGLRAALKGAPVHPDRFANRTCREFLHTVCERLAERGAVRLFALRIGPPCESNVGLCSRLACDVYLNSRSAVGYPFKLFRLATSRRAWN